MNWQLAVFIKLRRPITLKKFKVCHWWALLLLILIISVTSFLTSEKITQETKDKQIAITAFKHIDNHVLCNENIYENKFEAIRRLETTSGYNKARQIIRLPFRDDLHIPEGYNSAWIYCGCRNDLGVDCEFGVGFEPYSNKWILFATTPEFGWHYVEGGTITFNPGEIITLILEVKDNKIRCTVYGSNNQKRWHKILPARGLRNDCSNGERVRIMTTLVLNEGKKAYSRNNRRFSAIVSTPNTEHQFDGSHGIAVIETKGNKGDTEWVRVKTFQPFFDEDIDLKILPNVSF